MFIIMTPNAFFLHQCNLVSRVPSLVSGNWRHVVRLCLDLNAAHCALSVLWMEMQLEEETHQPCHHHKQLIKPQAPQAESQ